MPTYGTKAKFEVLLCDRELLEFERKAEQEILTMRRAELRSAVEAVTSASLVHTNSVVSGKKNLTSSIDYIP